MRKAFIWGASDWGLKALEYTKNRFEILGFIDQRASSNFCEFSGRPVCLPESFFTNGDGNFDMTIIIAISFPAEAINYLHNTHFKGDVFIFDGRGKTKNDYLIYKVENGEICVPEYMDKRFNEYVEYSLHYNQLNLPVLQMFNVALEWVGNISREKPDTSLFITEIGCGSGQYANMLLDNGFYNYVGVDFSSKAIELAQTLNPRNKEKFICENVFKYLSDQDYTTPQDHSKPLKRNLFICFEVLEHIKNDKELLNLLPYNTEIIFSVPSFKSFNHIRTFESFEAIQNRYKMLNMVEHIALPANKTGEKVYHLVSGIKS